MIVGQGSAQRKAEGRSITLTYCVCVNTETKCISDLYTGPFLCFVLIILIIFRFAMAYKRKASARSGTSYGRKRPYAKRRSYRYSRPKRRVTRRKKTVPISKFTLAQLDPFSEKVMGVKIPDVNTQPSSTVVVEDEYTMASDATYGVSVNVFRPLITAFAVSGTPAGPGGWTWSAGYGGVTNSSKRATIIANNTAVRSCSHGLRISCALAPTSVTGFVHIAIVTESEFSKTTWSFPTTVSQLQTSQWYKRVPLAMLTQRPFKVVNKILDHNGFRYIDPSSDLADTATDMTLHTSGWANVIVAVTGVPVSTNCLSVESILHLETLPSPGSAQTVTPAANASSQAVEQATNVANSSPAVFEEGAFGNFLQGAANAAGEVGGALYDATLHGARQAGYNAISGLGAAAFHWLQGGANPRMIMN